MEDHNEDIPPIAADDRFTLVEPAHAGDNPIFVDFMSRERNRHGLKAIVPKDWQVAAANEMLQGRDSFVVTATGSGKSLCYQLALVTRNDGYILAIFPLLSLMKDQIESAQKRGISACRITRKTQNEDPNLIKDVCRGKYQLICIGPEFVDPKKSNFASILNSSIITKGLIGIVVDEAHLCYTW